MANIAPASNPMENFTSFKGPSWHIEKPNSPAERYTIVVNNVCKDLEAAKKVLECHKVIAVEQLKFEKEGALNYTVFEPLPIKNSENYVVINIAGFKSEAFCKSHSARKDSDRLRVITPFMELFKNGSIVMNTNFHEAGQVHFANSCH